MEDSEKQSKGNQQYCQCHEIISSLAQSLDTVVIMTVQHMYHHLKWFFLVPNFFKPRVEPCNSLGLFYQINHLIDLASSLLENTSKNEGKLLVFSQMKIKILSFHTPSRIATIDDRIQVPGAGWGAKSCDKR